MQRVVCGGCLDYKVVVALDADKFGAWVSGRGGGGAGGGEGAGRGGGGWYR